MNGLKRSRVSFQISAHLYDRNQIVEIMIDGKPVGALYTQGETGIKLISPYASMSYDDGSTSRPANSTVFEAVSRIRNRKG